MAWVFSGQCTLNRFLGLFERAFFRLACVDPSSEQNWLNYAVAILLFNLAGIILLFVLLILQGAMPFNPQHLGPMAPDLALNTAVSFVTNTSWQAYAGETTLSDLSQMAGITVQSFLSAATGMAVAIAMVRGFARHGGDTIGNAGSTSPVPRFMFCCLFVLLGRCFSRRKVSRRPLPVRSMQAPWKG